MFIEIILDGKPHMVNMDNVNVVYRDGTKLRIRFQDWDINVAFEDQSLPKGLYERIRKIIGIKS